MNKIGGFAALGFLITVIIFGLSGDASGNPQSASANEPADPVLLIKAILIGDDLSLKPVPKREFRIHGGPLPEPGVTIKTSFQGEASITISPGEYRVTSETPVEFEGKAFTWDVSVILGPGDRTVVELSNDNAHVEETEKEPDQEVALDEGSLYRIIKDGVVKVISEGGHGSGFLVDSSGLILTNHHVVWDSDYLAVKIDDTHKFEAVLVAYDEFNDLALIRINPDVITNMPVLKLAKDEPDDPPVSVGERVLAIGSPLATETILTLGIVSKVEQGAIYSDVSINPGNSGGPLFNMRGEVIGVNTFGVPTASGPGVSGIVRIYLAKELLNEGLGLAADSPPPSDRELPVESTFRFPAEQLRETALGTAYNPKLYHIEAGQIDLQLMTPVVLACLEVADEVAASKRQKRRSKKSSKKPSYEPGKDFYNWRQYVGHYRPVVVIQAIPEIKLTGGSAFAVAMIGNYAHRKYRFKTDFVRMELLRNGVAVEPLHPGRTKEVTSVEGNNSSMEDIGVWGRYEYPPEAFKPGAVITLRLWNSDKPQPRSESLKPELVRRIWSDFRLYFEAFEEKVSG